MKVKPMAAVKESDVWIRRICLRAVKSRVYDPLVAVVILLNTVTLCMQVRYPTGWLDSFLSM